MNKKLTLTLAAALLLSLGASAQVSDYGQLRTNSWSLYGIGGVSTAAGDALMSNVNASADTFVSPMGGAGLTYNIRPWVRLGLGYETSKYLRQQRWAAVQTDGVFYKNLEVAYHAAEFDIDFNLAQLFRQKGQGGRFNAYVGSGFGALLGYGANYAISMGQKETVDSDPMNDNYSFVAWLKAGNTRVDVKGPYIPANISLEYDITPRFTVGLKGDLKCLLSDPTDVLPARLHSVGVLLRVNLVGEKQGYRCKSKQIAALESDLSSSLANAKDLGEKNSYLVKSLEAEKQQNASLKNELNNVKASLDDCGDADLIKALQEEIKDLKAEEFVVYFENASDKIGRTGLKTVEKAAERLASDQEATVVITSSCSTPGGVEYNKDLSDRRAAAVRQALVDKGVSESRITDIVSLGKEGMTEAANCRRAVIYVR